MKALFQLIKDKTVVVIAFRLRTVAGADKELGRHSVLSLLLFQLNFPSTSV